MLNIASLSPREQVQLSTAGSGGFGLPAQHKLCNAAYIGSWALAAHFVPMVAPMLQEHTANLDSVDTNLAKNIRIALSKVPQGHINLDRLSQRATPNIQRSLAEKINTDAAEEYKAKVLASGNKVGIAAFHSMDDDKAGNWLDALPSSPMFRLMDGTSWLLMAMSRLMLPVCKDLEGATCKCGQTIDVYGHHFLTCKHCKFYHRRHEDILKQLLACGNSVDLRTVRAWAGMYGNSSKLWDIVFLRWPALPGVKLGADLSITSATCPSNLNAAQQPGGAAAARAKKKNDKYQPVPTYYEFKPFVLEAFGRWGPELAEWWDTMLKGLSSEQRKLSSDNTPWNASSFKRHWAQRISLNLQSNNGLMMQAALDAARLERHTHSLIAAQCTAAQPSTSSDDSDTASPAASVTTTSPAARATSPVHVAATPENLYNTILDQDTPSLAALD